jgi:hypothetical protein
MCGLLHRPFLPLFFQGAKHCCNLDIGKTHSIFHLTVRRSKLFCYTEQVWRRVTGHVPVKEI